MLSTTKHPEDMFSVLAVGGMLCSCALVIWMFSVNLWFGIGSLIVGIIAAIIIMNKTGEEEK